MAQMFVAYLDGYEQEVGIDEIIGEELQNNRREWCDGEDNPNEFIGETPQEAIDNMICHYFSHGRDLMDEANRAMRCCDIALSARSNLSNIKIKKMIV